MRKIATFLVSIVLVFTLLPSSGIFAEEGTQRKITAETKEGSSTETKYPEKCYYVANNEGLKKAVADIANDDTNDEVTMVLTASLGSAEPFFGVPGKHIYLRSEDPSGRGYAVNLGDNLQGDLSFGNVRFGKYNSSNTDPKMGSIFANGHTLEFLPEFTENVANVYGGGFETDVENDTNIIIRGGKFSRIFGGCHDGTVKGNTNILIDYPKYDFSNASAGIVYGGGKATKSELGNVEGDTNITFRAGYLNEILGGGCNMHDTSSKTPARVHGDTHIVVGTDQVQDDVDIPAVVGNGVAGGSYYSSVYNTHIKMKATASMNFNSVHDIAGAGNNDIVNGTVEIITEKNSDVGHINFGGIVLGEPNNKDGVHVDQSNTKILNQDQKEWAVTTDLWYTNAWNDQEKYLCYGTTYGYGSTEIEGNCKAVVHDGYINMIRDSADDTINGFIDVTIENGLIETILIDRDTLKQPSNTKNKITFSSNANVIVGFIQQFQAVSLQKKANVVINAAAAELELGDDYVDSIYQPFIDVDDLMIEEGATLTTREDASDTDITKLNGTVVNNNGTWIANGHVSIKNDLTSTKGMIFFKEPALIQGNATWKQTELRLPVVTANNYDAITHKDIALTVQGISKGVANVLTVDKGNYATAVNPKLKDNYVLSKKINENEPTQEVYILKNENSSDGYYLKRVNDLKDAEHIFMWQVAQLEKHSVTYQFESNSNKPLPVEVQAYLPKDENLYLHGTEIKAQSLTKKQIDVKEGVWNFMGWDAESKIATADVTFIGTWVFTPHEYKITYIFESETKDKALPKEVTDLLPKDDKKYAYGTVITMAQPTKTQVVVSDGMWIFKGWDKESLTITSNTSMKGTWEFRKQANTLNVVPSINAADKTITVGDSFDAMKDVTATDLEDGDLTKQIVVVKNEVDTAKPGKYEVTYQVTDSGGATTTKTVYVTVKAKAEIKNEAPSINAADKTITEGESFDAMKDVTATDLEDGDLTKQIVVVKNEVDTAKPGKYEVIYQVTDSNGAITTKTIYVTVKAKVETNNHPPIIQVHDKTIEVGQDFDALDKILASDKEDGIITDSITILHNSVDTTKPGVYEVVYSVTDSHGVTTIKTIKVTVKEKANKPGTTDTTKKPTTEKESNPSVIQTGDSSMVALWIGLLLISVSVLGWLYRKSYHRS